MTICFLYLCLQRKHLTRSFCLTIITIKKNEYEFTQIAKTTSCIFKIIPMSNSNTIAKLLKDSMQIAQLVRENLTDFSEFGFTNEQLNQIDSDVEMYKTYQDDDHFKNLYSINGKIATKARKEIVPLLNKLVFIITFEEVETEMHITSSRFSKLTNTNLLKELPMFLNSIENSAEFKPVMEKLRTTIDQLRAELIILDENTNKLRVLKSQRAIATAERNMVLSRLAPQIRKLTITGKYLYRTANPELYKQFLRFTAPAAKPIEKAA